MKKITKISLISFFLILAVFLVAFGIKLKSLTAPQNILILGLDPRNDALEQTETTDTIIFANLNFDSGAVKLVSFPRDLWYYPLSTKINQIYPLSLSATSSADFIKTNFSHLVGRKIDRYVVLTTQNLEKIIDLVGGVDVNLEKGFTDTEYPNPEYIKNPSPQIPVYITITFPAGENKITAANVAQFVRSRKGAQTAADGGTDLGRIERQQLLLQSLFQKMLTLKSRPAVLFNLYQYYRQNIITDFAQSDMEILAVKILPHLSSLKLTKIAIPIGIDPKTDIIYDPEKLVDKQWVFLPQDNEYLGLHLFLEEKI